MSQLFKKYPSLTNASQSKFIDNVKLFVQNQLWIVTEKIHGANFQVIFDKYGKMNFASRNQFLGEFASFYDLPGLKETKYKEKTLVQRLTDLYDFLLLYYGNMLEKVNIYGEYAGTLTQGNSVQKEVQYGPQDFYIFDIMVTTNDNEFFLNKLVVRELCEIYNLAQPALLFVSPNFELALQVPNDFDSISGDHRYSKEVYDKELTFTGKNITEGVVIEPVEVQFYKYSRIIIKNKNQKFSENHSSKPMKKESILSEDEQQFFDLIKGYSNTNRVSNICSHYGFSAREDVQKNFGLLVKETLQDAINDIKKDVDDIELLEKVIKLFSKSIANSVREHLLSL